MEVRIYKVLLMDVRQADDRLIQKFLTETQERRVQFCRVSTYAEAIYQVRTEKWDAILVNQDFGSHSGLELIHHARLWNKNVPILLFSDGYNHQLEYKARKVGASDYFEKESLTPSVLNAVLGNNQNRQPGDQRAATFSRLQGIFSGL